MIPVTKPYLPPIEKYQKYVEGIYQRQWLTNNGPLVNEFELQLKDYLEQNHLLYVSNGTIALQIAIKALKLKGEIITTPFSYVATTSSIVWEGCTPVYVDIDEGTLNIDPKKIEDAITGKTSAILATHCFGNACDIDAIDGIAKKHNLKVIYDAAHCFGTQYKGKSIFGYGDISTCSLHATKLMHSIEGGLVVTKDPDLLKRMAYMRNFGHDGPEKFNGVGINAKNSEFHAAMGLAVLDDIKVILERRREQSKYYDEKLSNLEVKYQKIQEQCDFNFAYYPIVFKSEEICLATKKGLEINEIFPRRYFYPSLSKLEYVGTQSVASSNSISKRILCLPVFHTLSKEEQDMVCRILLRIQNN
ncbi:aminotransferase DegT [Marivirga tractuosa]|uniref:DegT/DnrJ/EryC1/StrS aminotransferase n=1 Tax=Marivirga tractuosa (strain ATCC 23168 / DSM 4126 / NBRC 15989 / NCIMB 1408 / VKM B-1430 / H-43) TaxID=643867 RepID=E4TQN3_MARTH|nr:DegT/DnrJ/EryC1/StrS family aminotransferase [Marivirga tractuosa]ADR20594.1 DegT/DnrJ/EryC1/StrS aminotransferase [Marivirga tractuosa DSM 4126]BDD14956.1 aminotransferase DegT [Marivirga tractuosa]